MLSFMSISCWLLNGQGNFFMKDDVSEKIKFEFYNNLIIIPLEINNVKLSFVLDTGVTKPILFNLSESDSLDLKDTETFYLHGLGANGKIKALRSSYNKFQVGDAVGVNQDLFVVFDNTINFTPRLGVLVHGIIGYDLFKDFVVEINYKSKYIRLHKLNSFKPKSSKRWKMLPLDIHNKKPHVNAKVIIDKKEQPVKLLIDTGGSDALWLFEDKKSGLIPNKDLNFIDYLGKGLSGSIYGKRSKVKNLRLSDFNLKSANVAFPDSVSIDFSKVHKGRDGSLGGDILKRFNSVFDYKNEVLYLKKNGNFKDPFTYNNSGIVLEHNGTMFVKERIKVPSTDLYNTKNDNNSVQIDFSINYMRSLKPMYRIVEIRKSSNAYSSGLRKGDVLISVNGKPSYNSKLSEINEIFHGKTGRSVRLAIERKGVSMVFKFKLDNAFKTEEPSN